MTTVKNNPTVGSLKDTDIEVAQEDQDKINRFARLYQRMEETNVMLAIRKKTSQDLGYACDEVMLLDADAGPVPVLNGEAFFFLDSDEAQVGFETLKFLFLCSR